MGCICTEPPKKSSNLDILVDSGEPLTISQNEQKPDKHTNQEKHSNQEISLKNCTPASQTEEVDKKSSTSLPGTYSLDSKAESDVSCEKPRKTISLTPETTSDDMKQSIGDFTLVIARAVTLEQCLPGDNRSPKRQWERVVVSELSLPGLKPLKSAKTSSAELTKARKELDHMKSKNKQMDEEIHNLKAENYRLKENALSKTVNIARKSLSLKERHSSMRRRRLEIEKSAGISHKILPEGENIFNVEQEHKSEPTISITQVSELHEISPKKESSLHWRATPREARPPEEIVETEFNWTFSGPIVLQ